MNTRDVTSILVAIWNEDYVEPFEVFLSNGKDPLNPAEVLSMKSKEVVIKLPSLYMLNHRIDVNVKYRKKNVTLNHYGLKRIKFPATIFYKSYNNSKPIRKMVKQQLMYVIANSNRKGMKIIVRMESLCLWYKPLWGLVEFGHDCSLFFFGTHNLVTEYGFCVTLISFEGRLRLSFTENCKTKSLYWNAYMFKFFNQPYNEYFDSTLIRGEPPPKGEGTASDPLRFIRGYDLKLSYSDSSIGSQRDSRSEGTLIPITISPGSSIKSIFCHHHKTDVDQCLLLSKLGNDVLQIRDVRNYLQDFVYIGFEYDIKQSIFKHKTLDLYARKAVEWDFLFIAESKFQYWRKKLTFVAAEEYSRHDLIGSMKDLSKDESFYVHLHYMYLYVDWVESGFRAEMIWPSTSDCAETVGSGFYTRINGCKQLKGYCPHIKSGEYHLGTWDINGKVYCDMRVDGAWTLISRHEIPGPNKPFEVTENIFEVVSSNYTKHLSSAASILIDKYNVRQLRFYCTTDNPGRTFHVRTFPSHNRNRLIEFIRGNINAAATRSEFTFFVYPDDNSILSKNFGRWGSSNPASLGYDSHVVGYEKRIYELMYIPSENKVSITQDLKYCDFVHAPNHKKGKWEIYIN